MGGAPTHGHPGYATDIDYYININLAFSFYTILTSLVYIVTSYYCLKVVKFRTLPNQPFGGKFESPFETRVIKFNIT